MSEKISLRTQSEHLNWLANAADRCHPELLRKKLVTEKEAPLRAERTAALIGTIRWLQEHEATVRALAKREARLQRIERALVTCFEAAATGVLTVDREGADWRLHVDGREVDVSLTEIAEAIDDMLMGRRS